MTPNETRRSGKNASRFELTIATDDWQLAALRRWTAAMASILLSVTWPLWWGGTEFPSVPVTAWLIRVPLVVDRVCCLALLCGLILLVVGWRQHDRWGWSIVLVSGLALGLLDQHRWQPWFYQLLLFSSIFMFGSPRIIVKWLTWLTISIYFYSALGKFDAEFLHTVGQQFCKGIYRLIDWVPSGREWHEQPIALIATLPALELLLAMGLAWPTTRRVAGLLAILFHLGLMALLGPLGLRHSAGVVLWNLQFAGQALWLFVLAAPNAPIELTETSSPNLGQRAANLLVSAIAVLAITLPLGERLGLWDHWTSWALYAPHSSRTEVWVASTAIKQLPPSLQQTMAEEQAANDSARLSRMADEGEEDVAEWSDELSALWRRVPIERWSLQETRTPIYPQARFQLGVARALAERIDSEFKLKAIVRSAAARWDGQRQSREYQGKSGLANASRMFWLGSSAR